MSESDPVALAIGDVVCLNADPEWRLTVEAFTYNKTTGVIVTVVWFEHNQKLLRDSVPREALSRIYTRDEARQMVKEANS